MNQIYVPLHVATELQQRSMFVPNISASYPYTGMIAPAEQKNANYSEELLKAVMKHMEDQSNQTEPKSAIIAPTSAAGILGVRQKPTPVPFQTLRRMAQIPAISAIILTRLNQVARYAKRPRFDGDTGFRIVLKDKDKQMSEAAKKRAFEIEEFFLKTGSTKNKLRKDNFNQFLRKIVQDSLVLDAMCWENVPNLKGELSEIWAVDAATIELVVDAPTGELDDPPVYVPVTRRGMRSSGDIAYVQRVNGQIAAEFTEEELAYGIRNPRTDLDYMGFGLSELEVLIEIVTGIVNGIKYNTTYFSHSHLPQGVLEIVGKYKDEHLEAFKRHWRTLTTGAQGKWSVPVLALEEGQGFKFTPFKNSNKDMEFNEFLEFLFNIACAVYQIDPNEVGFKSWTSGNSMSQTDNTAEKIAHSQDKGFIPLMNFLSDTFNSEIVDQIDPEFEFTWVGVNEEDEDKKLERMEKRLSMGLTTVAEERKKNDLDEILDEKGKPVLWTQAPANPQLLQVFMNGLQMQQQEHQANLAMKQSEQQHAQQMEQMEKQHKLGLESKQVDQDHAKNMAKLQQQQNAQSQEAMKKSLINEEELPDIPFEWEDY